MTRPPTLSIFKEFADPGSIYIDSHRLSEDNGQNHDFNEYTGIGDRIGKGTCHNSPLATMQLGFTVRAAGKQYVQRILDAKDRKIEVAKLVNEKILSGASIIDVGCGVVPTYARCVRALGAEVYTVDLMPTTSFSTWGLEPSQEAEVRELDARYHITQDLNASDAIEKIMERAAGPLHMVTQAHLFSSYDFRYGRWKTKKMLFDLLMLNGCYVGMDGCKNQIRTKEHPEKNHADL